MRELKIVMESYPAARMDRHGCPWGRPAQHRGDGAVGLLPDRIFRQGRGGEILGGLLGDNLGRMDAGRQPNG